MASLLARFVTEARGYTEMAYSSQLAFTKGVRKIGIPL